MHFLPNRVALLFSLILSSYFEFVICARNISEFLTAVYAPWFPLSYPSNPEHVVALAIKNGDKSFIQKTFEYDLTHSRLHAPLIVKALAIESLRQNRWDMFDWLTSKYDSAGFSQHERDFSFKKSLFTEKAAFNVGLPKQMSSFSFEYGAMRALLIKENSALNIGLFMVFVMEICTQKQNLKAIFKGHYRQLKKRAKREGGKTLLPYILSSIAEMGITVEDESFGQADEDNYNILLSNLIMSKYEDDKGKKHDIHMILWDVLVLLCVTREIPLYHEISPSVDGNIVAAIRDSIIDSNLKSPEVNVFAWYWLLFSTPYHGYSMIDSVLDGLLATCQIEKLKKLESLTGSYFFRRLFSGYTQRSTFSNQSAYSAVLSGKCIKNIEFLIEMNMPDGFNGLLDSRRCETLDPLIDTHFDGVDRGHLLRYYSLDVKREMVKDCFSRSEDNSVTLPKILINQETSEIAWEFVNSSAQSGEPDATFNMYDVLEAAYMTCPGCLHWFQKKYDLAIAVEVDDLMYIICDYYKYKIPFQDLKMFDDIADTASLRESFTQWALQKSGFGPLNRVKFGVVWEFLQKSLDEFQNVPEKLQIVRQLQLQVILGTEPSYSSMLKNLLEDGDFKSVKIIADWIFSSGEERRGYFLQQVYPFLIENVFLDEQRFPTNAKINYACEMLQEMIELECANDSSIIDVIPNNWSIMKVRSPRFKPNPEFLQGVSLRALAYILTTAKIPLVSEIAWDLMQLRNPDFVSILLARCVSLTILDPDRSLLFYSLSCLATTTGETCRGFTVNVMRVTPKNLYYNLKKSVIQQKLFNDIKKGKSNFGNYAPKYPRLLSADDSVNTMSFSIISKFISILEKRDWVKQFQVILKVFPVELALQIIRSNNPEIQDVRDGDLIRIFSIGLQCREPSTTFSSLAESDEDKLEMDHHLLDCFYDTIRNYNRKMSMKKQGGKRKFALIDDSRKSARLSSKRTKPI